MGRKAEDTVVIRNIYVMMAYAFKALDVKEYSHLGKESFDNYASLLAAILCIGISIQRRRGFESGYTNIVEDLVQIRGTIDVRGTARLKAAGRTRAVCSFDEWSQDTEMNRVLKTCAGLLLRNPEVRIDLREELKRDYLEMSEIGALVPPYRIEWSRMIFHKGNPGYVFLMNACYMVLSRFIPVSLAGDSPFGIYTDSQELHALFEKFVLEYFKREHAELSVSAKVLPAPSDAPSFLPRLCTDVTLESDSKVLIIDTKFYGTILNIHNGREMMSPAHRHQIVDYVVHESYKSRKEVSGMLLYALTDNDPSMCESWNEIGHTWHLWTLDLGLEFSEISRVLDAAADLVGGVSAGNGGGVRNELE